MPGWDVQKILDQVDKRTEGRASDKLDLRAEFFQGLDEFVLEQHFWWSKKRVSFTTIIGTSAYDLSATAPDLSQIESAILLDNTGTMKQADMTPIIDPVGQDLATRNTVPDTPSTYFLDYQTGPFTIRLGAPANVAQVVMIEYWACPSMGENDDIINDDIPLIPPHLQWGALYIVLRRVFEFLYGQEDPRYVVAEKRYQDFLLKASRRPHWTTQRQQSLSVGAHSAVRASTGHRRR